MVFPFILHASYLHISNVTATLVISLLQPDLVLNKSTANVNQQESAK